ncbi:MAG: hypothetical protein JOZ81_18110 [Chloroflexi bacterium]|nr:hypothetical protein [Chloroflexota bacterium]
MLKEALIPGLGRYIKTLDDLELEEFALEREIATESLGHLYPNDNDVEAAFQERLRLEGPVHEQRASRIRAALLLTETESRLHRYGREQLASSLEYQRRTLGQVLNYWLELGAVKPRLGWWEDRPEIQLGGYGLIAALAVQVLFDCARTDGLVVCTSCGTPFLPTLRRPRRDRNAYCSDCGTKAAARDAAARYRRTQKYKATYQEWLKTRRK